MSSPALSYASSRRYSCILRYNVALRAKNICREPSLLAVGTCKTLQRFLYQLPFLLLQVKGPFVLFKIRKPAHVPSVMIPLVFMDIR